MAGNSQAKRHIPKRASNTRKKETRVSCWVTGERRKEERRKIQDAAAKRNREARARGELTPWQAAKAARHSRRAAVRIQPHAG